MFDANELLVWLGGLLPYLYVLLILIALDLIGGVAIALKQRKFVLERVADFLINALLLMLAWFMAAILGFVPTYFGIDLSLLGDIFETGLGLATWAFVALKYIASIFGHIAAIKELPATFTRMGIKATGFESEQVLKTPTE